MSIGIPDADFTPQLAGYTGQGQFRFWCQKVLPIVYDDSLSYYELLNKVVDYLNNVIADVGNVEDNVQSLYIAYIELQSYVNSYFNSLDVQNEINNKLDVMAENGSLSRLIEPFVVADAPGIITEWLENNITPTEPLVDGSLTVGGGAADAKVTGDYIFSGEAQKTVLFDSLYLIGADSEYFLDSDRWVFGVGINNETGANDANASDSCRTIYFQLSATSNVINLPDSNYIFNVYAYKTANVSDFAFKLKAKLDNTPVVIGTPGDGYKYYRICVKKADGSTFDDDLTDPNSDANIVMNLINNNRKIICKNQKRFFSSAEYNSVELYKSNETESEATTTNGVEHRFVKGKLSVNGTTTENGSFILQITPDGGSHNVPSYLRDYSKFYI